jgi:hypothetical protein
LKFSDAIITNPIKIRITDIGSKVVNTIYSFFAKIFDSTFFFVKSRLLRIISDIETGIDDIDDKKIINNALLKCFVIETKNIKPMRK